MTDHFEKKVAVDGPVINEGELGSSTFSPGQVASAGPLVGVDEHRALERLAVHQMELDRDPDAGPFAGVVGDHDRVAKLRRRGDLAANRLTKR